MLEADGHTRRITGGAGSSCSVYPETRDTWDVCVVVGTQLGQVDSRNWPGQTNSVLQRRGRARTDLHPWGRPRPRVPDVEERGKTGETKIGEVLGHPVLHLGSTVQGPRHKYR